MNGAAMYVSLGYRIFQGPPKEPHTMCDLGYWRKYYQRKGNAMLNHGKSLDKTVACVDTRIKVLVEATVAGEKKLIMELKHLKAMDAKQAQQYFDDAKEYFAAAKKLDSFEDSPALKLKKKERQFLKDSEKFEEALGVMNTKKQNYYAAMANLEKVEIKKMLAIKSRKMKHYNNKYDELKKLTQKLVDKYAKALRITKDCVEELERSAQLYQLTYSDREIARGKHVMASMHDSIELSHSWKHGSKDSQFDEVDVTKIVTNRVAQFKQMINVPAFEPYVYTGNKKELWDRMRHELEHEESGSCATLGSRADLNNDEGDKTDGEDRQLTKAELKRAKKQRKEKAFVVVVAYKKQNKQELSLKKGELVIPILQENQDGFGYGEVRRGKFGKKKRGFYPMSHVVSGSAGASGSNEAVGDKEVGPESEVVPESASVVQVCETTTKVMAISILPSGADSDDED